MIKLLPLSTRLSDECLKVGVSRHIVEKDYALSWVLAGISEVPALKKFLIFKGGTCLKKCYFGSYRYSEDLDFSTLGNAPVGEELENIYERGSKQSADIPCRAYWRYKDNLSKIQRESPSPF